MEEEEEEGGLKCERRVGRSHQGANIPPSIGTSHHGVHSAKLLGLYRNVAPRRLSHRLHCHCVTVADRALCAQPQSAQVSSLTLQISSPLLSSHVFLPRRPDQCSGWTMPMSVIRCSSSSSRLPWNSRTSPYFLRVLLDESPLRGSRRPLGSLPLSPILWELSLVHHVPWSLPSLSPRLWVH